MMEVVAVGVFSFLYVGCKSAQQLNVIYRKWVQVPFFSFSMAGLEVAGYGISLTTLLEKGWLAVIPMALATGLGSTLGCWVTMYAFRKIKH